MQHSSTYQPLLDTRSITPFRFFSWPGLAMQLLHGMWCRQLVTRCASGGGMSTARRDPCSRGARDSRATAPRGSARAAPAPPSPAGRTTPIRARWRTPRPVDGIVVRDRRGGEERAYLPGEERLLLDDGRLHDFLRGEDAPGDCVAPVLRDVRQALALHPPVSTRTHIHTHTDSAEARRTCRFPMK